MQALFTIRHADIAEFDALAELFEQLDEHHRLALPHIFRAPASGLRDADSLQALIDGPESAILVAEQEKDRSPLGLAVLIDRRRPESPVRAAQRFVEIDALVVRASARRRGVGRALIAASRQWALSRGITSQELSVWSFNHGAEALYEQMGFRPCWTRFATTAT